MSKTAVITGGTRGIGLETVRLFAENGYHVVFYGSRKETVDKALAQLDGLEVEGKWTDLTDEEAIRRDFRQIAEIEKVHAERFERFAKFLRENKLFVSDVETGWMCLNCGHVVSAKQAPAKCPVCSHDQGFFIRLELSPYER